MKSKYGPGGEFEPDWYVLLSFYFLKVSSSYLRHVGHHLVIRLHLIRLQIHPFHPFLIPLILRLLDLLGALIIPERRKRKNQKLLYPRRLFNSHRLGHHIWDRRLWIDI